MLADCIEFNGCKDKDGYGKIGRNGKTHRAHRYFWEQHYGKIPEGFIVRHFVCDNPSCININHLKLGTSADNTKDMMNKKRHPFMFVDFCKRGHPRDNFYTDAKTGKQRCRSCNNIKAKEYRDRKKITNAR